MTSLLPDRDPPVGGGAPPRPAAPPPAGAARARWAAPLAAAARCWSAWPLGVVGWFLTDAGAHGAPRDGLAVGALGWLMAHGSGVHVAASLVTVDPARHDRWPAAGRPGGSGTGSATRSPATARTPTRIADGERDWTVPVAAACSSPAATSRSRSSPASLAATAGDGARHARAWCSGRSLLCVVLGAPAIAIGSGRAAIWTATLPAVAAWPTAAACRRILGSWLAGRRAGGLRWSPSSSTSAPRSTSCRSCTLDTGGHALAPAGLAAGGAQRRGLLRLLPARARVHRRHRHDRSRRPWSPSAPLPMFPLLAALPDNGPTPAWTAGADRRAAAASPPLGAARGPAPPPHAPLGGGRAARLRRRRARRRRCSGCSPRSPAARSVRAGCADVGPVRVRRAGARHHRVRHRRPARRPGDDLVAAARRPRAARGRPRPRAGRRVATTRHGTCGAMPSPRPSRAPRRPRLRLRHQPPGAARRRRRPGVRRRRSSPSAPTATASRGWPAPSGPGCRPSCTGSRTSPTARTGTRR